MNLIEIETNRQGQKQSNIKQKKARSIALHAAANE